MTRFYRGDRVTTGTSHRLWTVRRISGSMADLRDEQGRLATVPVSSLHLIWASHRWAIRCAIGAVVLVAVVGGYGAYWVADQHIALDSATSAVLLGIATVSVVAWMAVLLRGIWRRS